MEVSALMVAAPARSDAQDSNLGPWQEELHLLQTSVPEIPESPINAGVDLPALGAAGSRLSRALVFSLTGRICNSVNYLDRASKIVQPASEHSLFYFSSFRTIPRLAARDALNAAVSHDMG